MKRNISENCRKSRIIFIHKRPRDRFTKSLWPYPESVCVPVCLCAPCALWMCIYALCDLPLRRQASLFGPVFLVRKIVYFKSILGDNKILLQIALSGQKVRSVRMRIHCTHILYAILFVFVHSAHIHCLTCNTLTTRYAHTHTHGQYILPIQPYAPLSGRESERVNKCNKKPKEVKRGFGERAAGRLNR